jgi:hypothetical protein
MYGCILLKKKKIKYWNNINFEHSLKKNNSNIIKKKKINIQIKYTQFILKNEICKKIFNKIINIKSIRNNINLFLYNNLEKIKKNFKEDIHLLKNIFLFDLKKQIEIASFINESPKSGTYFFIKNRLFWLSDIRYTMNNLILKSRIPLLHKLMYAASLNNTDFINKNIIKIKNKKTIFNKIIEEPVSLYYNIRDYQQNIFASLIHSNNLEYIKYFFNKYDKYITYKSFILCIYKSIYRNYYNIFKFLMVKLNIYMRTKFGISFLKEDISKLLFSIINNPYVDYGYNHNDSKFVKIYINTLKKLDLINEKNCYINKIISKDRMFYTNINGQVTTKTTILIECVVNNPDSYNILKVLFNNINFTKEIIEYNYSNRGNIFLLSIEYLKLDVVKLLYNYYPEIVNKKYNSITPLHVVSLHTNLKTKNIDEFLLFLLNCPNIKKNIEDKFGRTPFMICHPDYYYYFKIKNNDIFNKRDRFGNNILMSLLDKNNVYHKYTKHESIELLKFKKILKLTPDSGLNNSNNDYEDIFTLILNLKCTVFVKRELMNSYYYELYNRKQIN